jgi:tight adherence protein B
MTIDAHGMYLILGGGAFVVALLIVSAVTSGAPGIEKRLARVGPQEARKRKIAMDDRANSVRSTKDSTIPLLDRMVKLLPNPDKLRARIARTGHNLSLGEYLLVNALAIFLFYILFVLLRWNGVILVPLSVMLGLLVPHAVTGIMGARRMKKFNANFPEAIDTMCRGIRSGLPITESIGAVGREMPDPIGVEFHRISDGVRMGKSLESAMWEVARRIDTAEFRFLIIAMAIQKETGGNLAETLGNLADLIRKRRQLRLKIKAMSSEAKASAMIIGSLPFIMFLLLLVVNAQYGMVLFHRTEGRFILAVGLIWMSVGWGVMLKMIHFEI